MVVVVLRDIVDCMNVIVKHNLNCSKLPYYYVISFYNVKVEVAIAELNINRYNLEKSKGRWFYPAFIFTPLLILS